MNQVTHDDIMESVKRLFEFTSVQYAGGISPGSDAAHEAIGMLLEAWSIGGGPPPELADEETARVIQVSFLQVGMPPPVLAACLPAFICGVMAARIADERTERETTDSTPPETA